MGVDFSRVADRYDESRGGEQRGIGFAEEMAPHLPPGPLLEIGVGTGIVALALQALGRPPLGADIAAAMLGRARARLGPCVVRYDGRRLPFASGSLAAAYSVWVLHLVEDQAGFFADVYRVLRPGGRFLIAPVNYPSEDDEISRVTKPMYDALLAGREGRDNLDRLSAIARTVGLSVVSRLPGHHFQQRVTAADEMAHIERRDPAILWDLPDDRWREVVEPVLQQLRDLGDLGVERDSWHELLVLERPNQPASGDFGA